MTAYCSLFFVNTLTVNKTNLNVGEFRMSVNECSLLPCYYLRLTITQEGHIN